MTEGGRNAIRDSLVRRSRRILTRPTDDVWGPMDLWKVNDLYFRRPDETLVAAVGRWGLYLLRNAVRTYLTYLTFCLLVAFPGAVFVQWLR